ncbi:bifunctional diaminohydroxyphosphoribosylaminopyrimidine deaminase/5-amino-6-(5-phosphoribosylamino)uracil reductase RibD [Catellatospora citrea]|uniref:bifunctional diaminohydroxyphosphoribosylaminopyrimidine deaminase/5-amino-6-(5-phosphoribosylamino)uracil reductase RibD n=1 Tax=Catellatospora citrea TaxID=53366 RepID=UPI0033D99DAF
MASEDFTAERSATGSAETAQRVIAASDFVVASGYGVGGVVRTGASATESLATDLSAADVHWMRRAILTAMEAEGRASPNPTVGAVIVKDGVLLSAGATEPFGGRHAERCAIENVTDRSVLRGATLYTTLEPCAHWGKQPPCADLVAACGFARCVVGIRDPNPRVAGVGFARVRAAGTEVVCGVLRNETIAWHLPYLVPRLLARPMISTFALDTPGTIESRLLFGHSGWWDSAAVSRDYRAWLKHRCDLLVTEPSATSVDKAAFARGAWRGLVWWDVAGRLADMTVTDARDLAARARALGAPLALVAAPGSDNAAQLDAVVGGGITHVIPQSGLDPASWLASSIRDGELAAVIGGMPNWVLVDEHPRLAAALAAMDAIDVIHVLETRGGSGEVGNLCAWPAETTGDAVRIARIEAADATIGEYYTQGLSSALRGTSW